MHSFGTILVLSSALALQVGRAATRGAPPGPPPQRSASGPWRGRKQMHIAAPGERSAAARRAGPQGWRTGPLRQPVTAHARSGLLIHVSEFPGGPAYAGVIPARGSGAFRCEGEGLPFFLKCAKHQRPPGKCPAKMSATPSARVRAPSATDTANIDQHDARNRHRPRLVHARSTLMPRRRAGGPPIKRREVRFA